MRPDKYIRSYPRYPRHFGEEALTIGDSPAAHSDVSFQFKTSQGSVRMR